MINSSNPYQTARMGTQINHDLDTVEQQMYKNQEEEERQKAPKILVYPLDQLTQVLSSAYTSLAQVYSLLNQAKQNPIINKKAIEKLQMKIDKINSLILNLPAELDNLGI